MARYLPNTGIYQKSESVTIIELFASDDIHIHLANIALFQLTFYDLEIRPIVTWAHIRPIRLIKPHVYVTFAGFTADSCQFVFVVVIASDVTEDASPSAVPWAKCLGIGQMSLPRSFCYGDVWLFMTRGKSCRLPRGETSFLQSLCMDRIRDSSLDWRFSLVFPTSHHRWRSLTRLEALITQPALIYLRLPHAQPSRLQIARTRTIVWPWGRAQAWGLWPIRTDKPWVAVNPRRESDVVLGAPWCLRLLFLLLSLPLWSQVRE